MSKMIKQLIFWVVYQQIEKLTKNLKSKFLPELPKNRKYKEQKMHKQTDKSPQKPQQKLPSEAQVRQGKQKKKQVPQNSLEIQQQITWKEDNSYGFDFAVYLQLKNSQHSHSIALVKQVNEFNTMMDLERWTKIAHSVNKQMWICDQQNNVVCKFQFCRNC